MATKTVAIVTGNSTNSDAVRNGKKTFMVGTIMVKGITIKEVNKQLHNSFAQLRSFPGATLKHLKYYVVPSLIDETFDRITLCAGWNDLDNKTQIHKRLLVT